MFIHNNTCEFFFTNFLFFIKMLSINHTNKLTYFESSCTQNKIKKICFQNVISDTIKRCYQFLYGFLFRKDLQTCL